MVNRHNVRIWALEKPHTTVEHQRNSPKVNIKVLATLAQSFLLIGLGMELSMPTIVIQALQYKTSNNEFSLTLSEISWYGSILYVFHPAGSFISGILQERYGRKRCMIFANVPSILGWIMLYRTNSSIMLYTSTVLMGLSIGFSEAPILSYVGEITEPRLRGSMSSLACTTSWMGCMLAFFLGYLFDWRTVALLSTLCPVTCMCLVACIPESPVWLIAKGKTEKAKEALCWLRGWTDLEAVDTEHQEYILYNQMSGNDARNEKADDGQTLLSKLKEFKDPSVYRPFNFVIIFFFACDLVGLWPCRPYFGKVMTAVNIDADIQSLLLLIISVLQTIGCLTVVLTVHHVGKRFLTILSFSLNTVLLCIFGAYILVIENGSINFTSQWIPITVLCCITYFGAIVSSIPWMLLGEIFPNKSRGIATGTTAGLSYLLMFVLTKLYPSFELTLTTGYTMITLGVGTALGLLYLYRCMPETENRTLLEIEQFFASKKSPPARHTAYADTGL